MLGEKKNVGINRSDPYLANFHFLPLLFLVDSVAYAIVHCAVVAVATCVGIGGKDGEAGGQASSILTCIQYRKQYILFYIKW